MPTPAPNSPVAITGLGVIGAIGQGVPAMDAALAEGREGLGRLDLWPCELAAEFPVGQYRGNLTDDLKTLRPAAFAGRAGARLLARMSRSDKLSMTAALEAVQQAQLTPDALEQGRAGCFLGQSVCGTLASEQGYATQRAGSKGRRHLEAMFLHEGANGPDHLARVLGLPGPALSFMTACSSGANAIGLAAEAIRRGEADIMLAGGGDSLSRIAFYGFCSLQVTSPDGPRPFDAARRGMSVGEGAGMVVLESAACAARRGAKPLAWLTGYGHSCDAHHLTAPHPQGLGALAAMRDALARAGVAPAGVGYVNAHGTATQDNDATEALAVRTLFGESAVPISSVKRWFGHTLAASGAIEAAVCVRALQRGVLPRNLGLRELFAGAGLDVLREDRKAPGLRHVLSNSFGFGGNNAALVFSRAE